MARATPLLTTKLTVPPLCPNLVSRPRLIARMQAGVAGKLTLIAAPAGFGKTTLLSAWYAAAASRGMPLAWVALDTADNDAMQFWRYIITALDTLAPGCGAAALALLQSPQPPAFEAALTLVLNTLSALPSDAVLVLDDYQVIATSQIHQTLAFLLDHLPSRLHVVMTTRADPPLPLARLRAQGALTELRAADLRFTADEAAAFLSAVMGMSLTPDQVAALEARTEGWVAGLQLAALAAREQAHPDEYIQAFTGHNRFVIDYLVDEVLDRQPAHIKSFLLHTAMLDRLCGPLCDAILGIENEELRIENVANHSQFSILNSHRVPTASSSWRN